ncbi:MAG: hypothetical protein E5Y63_29530 [Mesorhizobium sp.]|uniref:hypothetical protein n=1 Tax=Mesorhizobium sp. TaxID=1871066 RepID=UPI0011FB088C|nr:hypothetical protein [Mesorhizobium sp.]TIM26420.1 MAG: hypothetical protein E5Y63_29530 [Mesorhizobium sp.]
MESANSYRLSALRGNAGSDSSSVAANDVDTGALENESATAQTNDQRVRYRLLQRHAARRGSNDQRSARAIGRTTGMRIAGFASVGLIVSLSLLPGALEIRTGLPGSFEHFAAYLGTGAVLTAPMPDRSGVILLALIAAATVLEVFQGLVADRSPAVVDAFVGGVGAASGVGLIRFYRSWSGRDTAAGFGMRRLP